MAEALYFLCVDFMLAFADLIGMTYRDANMLILFGLLPAVLFCDCLIFLFLLISKQRTSTESSP